MVLGALFHRLLVCCGAVGYVSGLWDFAASAPDDGHNGARNMLSEQ